MRGLRFENRESCDLRIERVAIRDDRGLRRLWFEGGSGVRRDGSVKGGAAQSGE